LLLALSCFGFFIFLYWFILAVDVEQSAARPQAARLILPSSCWTRFRLGSGITVQCERV